VIFAISRRGHVHELSDENFKWSRDARKPPLRRVDFDAVIFECDGALIDASKSMHLSVKLLPCIIFDAPLLGRAAPGKGV